MRRVLEENPLPPSRFNVQAPAALDGVVQKALAKKAEDRFQSAGEFSAALHKAVQEGAASIEPTVIAPPLDPTVMAAPALGAAGIASSSAPGAQPAAALPPPDRSCRASRSCRL